MTFSKSVQTCFRKYADFGGRASRSEFWWFFLFVLLTLFLLTIVEAIVLGIWYPVEYPILPGLFIIGTVIPSFAVGARRLHDIDNTGWWQLLIVIPGVSVVGWIPLFFMWAIQGKIDANRYGLPLGKNGEPIVREKTE